MSEAPTATAQEGVPPAENQPQPEPAPEHKPMPTPRLPDPLLAELREPPRARRVPVRPPPSEAASAGRGRRCVVLPLEEALQAAMSSVGGLNINVQMHLGDREGTAITADVLRACADAVDALPTCAAINLQRNEGQRAPAPPPVIAAADPTPEQQDWVLPPSHGDLGSAFDVIESESAEGAKVALAKPCNPSAGGPGWNGKLLLCAHGYREPGTPHLHELHPEDTFVRQLVGQGWAVASTSYRRQGKVVVDGLRDVISLRTWALALLQLGEQQQSLRHRPLCILEGRSMGGAVAVLAAEGKHGALGLFDGVVAIGAALLHAVETDGEPCVFTHRPTVPLLFLTNQSELGSIEQYASRCIEALAVESASVDRSPEVVPPATWTVWREGHNLVSAQERFAALYGETTILSSSGDSCTACDFVWR